MKKDINRTGTIYKLLLVLLAVGFLSSCMSSTQFASRKYTKGHFSDPIAKVNVDYVPSGANTSVEPITKVNPVRQLINQNTNSSAISAPVAETKVSAAPKQQVTFTRQEKSVKLVVANNKSGTSINKNNVSLSDNAITSVTDHHGDSGSSGHHWLRYCLICLLIALVATILAGIVFLAGAFIFATLLYIISALFWIGFVIFGILWLIDILGGM